MVPTANVFLEYVRGSPIAPEAIRASTGRKLQDRVGESYPNLEAQLVSFLKGQPSAVTEPRPTAKARASSGGAIRTVHERQ